MVHPVSLSKVKILSELGLPPFSFFFHHCSSYCSQRGASGELSKLTGAERRCEERYLEFEVFSIAAGEKTIQTRLPLSPLSFEMNTSASAELQVGVVGLRLVFGLAKKKNFCERRPPQQQLTTVKCFGRFEPWVKSCTEVCFKVVPVPVRVFGLWYDLELKGEN
jgi:hypothetical protein